MAGRLRFFDRRLVRPAALGIPLIGPSAPASGMTFSRASNGTGFVSGALSTFGTDAARYTDSGLLMEGARTNAFPNPRLEGNSAGSPGTNPSSTQAWTLASVPGIAVQNLGYSTIAGMQGVSFRITGTAGASSSIFWVLSPAGFGFAANTGETWTTSLYCALVAGSLNGISLISGRPAARSSGGTGTGAAAVVDIKANLSAAPYLIQNTYVMPASTAGLYNQPTITLVNGATIDITPWFAMPQQELATFASSRILPLVGVPLATARARSNLSGLFTANSLPTTGFTVVGRSQVPQNAPTGIDQSIVQVDAGADTNSYELRIAAAGAAVTASRVLASVRADATTCGNMTAGASFGWAVAFDLANNTIRAAIEGGSEQSVAGGPAGMTTIRFGGRVTSGSELFGYFASRTGSGPQITALPYVAGAGTLVALAAGAP